MSMQTFVDDDDFASISTAAATATATTTATTTPSKTNGKAHATTPATSLVPDVDETGFGDEADERYLANEDYLPALKILRGEIGRFAFAPDYKLKHSRIHYFEGVGSVRCLSTKEKKAVCCSTGNNPKSRFVGLIFSYENTDKKTGKFASNDTKPVVTVKAVRLSRSNYQDLNSIPEENQDIHDLDLKMFHDPSRSFGYRFGRVSSMPRWKMLPEAEINALLEPYRDGTKLASRLGKVMTPAELKAIVTGVSEGIGGKLKASDFEEDLASIGDMGQ
jgi:hypothetical protein